MIFIGTFLTNIPLFVFVAHYTTLQNNENLFAYRLLLRNQWRYESGFAYRLMIGVDQIGIS